MIELRQYSRDRRIEIPDWANSLGASVISTEVEKSLIVTPAVFSSGFSLTVPLTDTTIYLDYLRDRLTNVDGVIDAGVRFEKIEDVDRQFNLIINCAGFEAKALVHDADLEPHRGQVAIVPKLHNLQCAIVCDDAPLMYAIPRNNDCVFGGTNEVSDNVEVDRASTQRIVTECARVLKIDKPRVLAERVGLRPFRKSGVRVEVGKLNDGRTVVHNYGHGGAGFTLSWGCAMEAFNLVGAGRSA
jgi:D-amino-acid oxidase